MTVNRRSFVKLSAGLGLGMLGRSDPAAAAGRGRQSSVPTALQALRPMTDYTPIADAERLGRIERAQRLMREQTLDAVLLESGSSLFYFTGVRWGTSERTFAAVIPARGELAWVTPKFEEERARELIRFGEDIRAWEEDESPYRRISQIFKDRGIAKGRVGIEERLRFFIFDGVRREAPGHEYVSADPVTAGCRMFKSSTELALMQHANDVTIAAYQASVKTLEAGMLKEEFTANARAAHEALGFQGSISVNFGESSAFPHGSIQPRPLREGDIVLMDGGCGVDGYRSDISRTIVFGEPTERQREIWNLERRAQDAAFAAAQVDVPCEAVDAAARKVIVDAGFGPDYRIPGLPHRTGHGIGLDGHEWTNLVRGNKTPLAPGMCFSDEPMIAIYGEFGIRLEDCFYMTEDGPTFFTAQSPSIEEPFG